MEKVDGFQLKCLDDIKCSCQKFDISGLQYQASRNGVYVVNAINIYGRKSSI